MARRIYGQALIGDGEKAQEKQKVIDKLLRMPVMLRCPYCQYPIEIGNDVVDCDCCGGGACASWRHEHHADFPFTEHREEIACCANEVCGNCWDYCCYCGVEEVCRDCAERTNGMCRACFNRE